MALKVLFPLPVFTAEAQETPQSPAQRWVQPRGQLLGQCFGFLVVHKQKGPGQQVTT